jgi:hypothetical protein
LEFDLSKGAGFDFSSQYLSPIAFLVHFSNATPAFTGGWSTLDAISPFWVPHPFGVWFIKGCVF